MKALGLPQIGHSELFNEAFGNLFARELGIPTPDPALIHLTPGFVEVANEQLAQRDLRLIPGVACGCIQFSPAYIAVSPFVRLGADSIDVASRIYGFDMLVQNPDRTVGRPNCATSGNNILAFDFEKCFSFTKLLNVSGSAKNINPWEFVEHNLFRNHIFRHELKSQNYDWDPFIAEIARIKESRLLELIALLPNEWCGSASRVVEHIMQVVQNSQKFRFEILRSLACV